VFGRVDNRNRNGKICLGPSQSHDLPMGGARSTFDVAASRDSCYDAIKNVVRHFDARLVPGSALRAPGRPDDGAGGPASVVEWQGFEFTKRKTKAPVPVNCHWANSPRD